MTQLPASRTWALRCRVADWLMRLAGRVADPDQRRTAHIRKGDTLVFYEAERLRLPSTRRVLSPVPCEECGIAGSHRGTCSKSMMRSGRVQ